MKNQGMTSAHMRGTEAERKSMLVQFPRKSKGKYERTAARAPDRNKYRKDFKRVPRKPKARITV